MDPIAVFQPDRAAERLKSRMLYGYKRLDLHRFRSIRNRPLKPQIPLFSIYTGIIPV
jgi:hypothetical protein